jgi:amino acid transporter
MGGFSSFALSFSIISVLTGIVTTYDVAIQGAGPIALGLGWPLVSIGTLIVALAMAELASAFPTAGALYHWSALLGGPGWGWMTAMTNLAGQVAIVAAIDLGCAKTLAAVLGHPNIALALFVGIIATHGLINVLSVRIVGWLNDFSATVHIVGVIVLVAALALFARAQPVGFLFRGGFTTREDGSFALGFITSLALGMYTFTGYDASAHISEETHDPARRAPRGIVTSVVVSAAAGYALACALALAIQDLPEVAKSAQPALFILQKALGNLAGDIVMAFAVAAMWFCGLSSVTSASRTLYAFSRDDGLPFSRSIKRVHPGTKTPHVAIALATILPCVLVGGTFTVSDRAFAAATSLATTALYVSYALPIALGAVARARGRWRKLGPWNLGRFGVFVAWLAVAWALGVVLAFFVPPNLPFGLVLAGLMLALAAVYHAIVRGKFEGPKVHIASLER